MKCPFTQEDVNSIDPRFLAITFNNSEKENPKCGHESFMKSLVSYLHDTDHSSDAHRSCPSCSELITDIYDGISNDIVLSKSGSLDHGVVSFKYGHFVYHLSVCRNKNEGSYYLSIFRGKTDMIHLAQDRISQVLDVDLKHLKILHKGKVLWPNKDKNLTARDISKKLIQISLGNAQNEGKKVSLVVMGTRRKEMESAKKYVGSGHLRHANTFRGWFGYYSFTGIMLLFGSFKTMVGGVILLFKSILPSNQISDDHRVDD